MPISIIGAQTQAAEPPVYTIPSETLGARKVVVATKYRLAYHPQSS
ncbi:MAG: hypothetical protein R6U89_08440 [Dehalococcoidia bacterium]